MSIYYKLYQNKRKGSTTKDKWYARSAVMGKTVSLEDLAEHMAQHNTPYSEGVIKGVLTDMITCIRELVLEGKAVKIPNLKEDKTEKFLNKKRKSKPKKEEENNDNEIKDSKNLFHDIKELLKNYSLDNDEDSKKEIKKEEKPKGKRGRKKKIIRKE